jgi:exosome complex RNA-binding protein Rrp42 (RNase PH superfamily)
MVGQIVSGNQGDVQVRVTSCWQGAGGDRDAQQQQLQQYLVLQSYVQRLLDDTLELTQLVIAQGQTAFSIQLFLQIVSDDGNLKDACLLAAVTALHDLQIPTNPLLLDKKVLLRNNDTYTNFKLECLPVSLSLGIWKNNHHESNKKPIVIVDPTLDEDSLLTSHMTVIVNANNLLQILSLDMSSSSSDSAVPASVIALAVKMAQARAKEVMETIWKRPIDTA